MAVTTRKKKSPASALNDSTSQYESTQNRAKKTKKNDDDDEWSDDESTTNNHDLDLDDDERSVCSDESDECRQLNNGDIYDEEEESDEEMEGDNDDELFTSTILMKMKERSTNSSFLQNKSLPSISMAVRSLNSMAVSAGLLLPSKKWQPSDKPPEEKKKKSVAQDHDMHIAQIALRMANRSNSNVLSPLREMSVEDIMASVTTSPHDVSTNLAASCGFLDGTTTMALSDNQQGTFRYNFTFEDGYCTHVCEDSISHAIKKGYVNANDVDLSPAYPQEQVEKAIEYGLHPKEDGTKFSVRVFKSGVNSTRVCVTNLRTGKTYDNFHKYCNKESIPITSITEPTLLERMRLADRKGFSAGWGLSQTGKNYTAYSPTGEVYPSLNKGLAADKKARLSATTSIEGKFTVCFLL